MPITLWLFPLFFLYSLVLNLIANYLIHNRTKLSLFPIFEIISTLSFVLLWHKTDYSIYFILFSALLIVIHTDLNSMLISRFTSLYLVPTGILASYYNLLPLDVTESIIAALIGYGFLFFINKLFYIFKKVNGIGQGDLDLIALIGSYTGLLGCWFAILSGSIVGTLIGAIYMLITNKKTILMPFGVFLSLGTIIYIIFQDSIYHLLFSL